MSHPKTIFNPGDLIMYKNSFLRSINKEDQIGTPFLVLGRGISFLYNEPIYSILDNDGMLGYVEIGHDKIKKAKK
jgi:hypothetical protein